MHKPVLSLAAVALLAGGFGMAPQLRAQEPAAAVAAPGSKVAPDAARGSLTVAAGAGRVLRLRGAATNIFTADPKVVEVRPASNNSVFLFGVAPGSTTVVAMGANGDTIAQYEVNVLPSDFDARQAGTAAVRAARHRVVSTPTETGVSLSGELPTPAEAEAAMSAAKGVLPADGKVDNRLRVGEGLQVSLRVRIAEMSRSLTRELGVNWTGVANLGTSAAFGIATNNVLADTTIEGSKIASQLGSCGVGYVTGAGCKSRGYQLNNVIDALSQDGLVHLLAEPNLTTMSGEPASFLVGGEFPIPVAASNGDVSVTFKQYGISLTFVPTVMSHNRIELHVRPEVSQLDKANGITSILNATTSIQIPALTVRRADTTVELGSGQSFAIAGLLSDQTNLAGLGVPGLGDIPVLGALFRSDSFQRKQTELVIVVTPYIVQPVNDPNALKLPTDGWHPPTDLERLLFFRTSGRGTSSALLHRIPADAGFVIE